MFYCGFNFLDKLLNGDLAAKIGQGILSKYLIDIEFNCSLPYKVNINCVYEGKCQNKCLIYEVKCLICDAIYIGNTHQTLKKKMDGHFSDLLCLLKNRNKSYSFAAHLEQHFNSTTTPTDLRNYMKFKVVKQINLIGAMKKITKPNCNLCIKEHLTILKKLHDKHVTVINNNSDIYGAFQHKTNFQLFS